MRAMGKGRSEAAGFTLVETLLAIGVAAGMAVATFALGSRAYDTVKVAQAADLAREVAGQVQSRFSVFPSFASLTTSPPSSFMGASVPMHGSFIRSPWGDAKLMAATVAVPADTWGIEFQGVPQAACSALVAKMSPNYYATAVNLAFSTAFSGKAVDPAEATALCDASVNDVMFVAPPTGAGVGGLAPACYAVGSTGAPPPAWIPPPGYVAPALEAAPAPTSACGSAVVVPSVPVAPTLIPTTY